MYERGQGDLLSVRVPSSWRIFSMLVVTAHHCGILSIFSLKHRCKPSLRSANLGGLRFCGLLSRQEIQKKIARPHRAAISLQTPSYLPEFWGLQHYQHSKNPNQADVGRSAVFFGMFWPPLNTSRETQLCQVQPKLLLSA